MLHDWGVIAAAFGYIGLLFFVASHGDRLSPSQRGRAGMLIYPLSLAIYCTSWTFFGSVGFATRTSVDFLAIYVGPILMIGLCTPLLRRVIQLAKSQNITSIADFIGARYGKSQAVAATVAMIAIVGSVPYIALQLKAMASSLETILIEDKAFSSIPIIGDIALVVTLAMAVFAVLFGTRQTDATEHQHGLMLAIATESIVKLVAFLAAGAFVTFWMFTPVELIERAMKTPEAVRAIDYTPSIGNFLTMTLLSFCAIMLLPRQFHVSVVENSSNAEVSRARWLFPLYLVAINLFVIPIAIAGLVTFPFGAVDSDMYVLALPIEGKLPAAQRRRLRRRPVGGDRDGDRGMRRAVDHGFQRHRAAAGAAAQPANPRRQQGFRRLPAPGAPLCDLRHHGDGVFLLSRARQHPAGGDRPVVVRGDRPACAGVLRRPVLAAGDRARRHGRHAGRRRGVDLHAVPAELPRKQHRRPAAAAAWPVRHRGAAPAGAVRRRSAAAAAWRAVEPLAQHPDLRRACRWRASRRRSSGCRPTCSCPTRWPRSRRPSGAGAPRSRCRTSRARWRNISVPSAPATPFEAFAAEHRGHARSVGAGRFRTAAACRAPDRVLDRRGLLAPRDVAAAAQAHRLRQGRAETARRFPRRAAFQPRDPADRAEPCAAGHRGVRRRSAADLLQPAVRRDPRAAAASRAARDSLAGNPGIHGRRQPARRRRQRDAAGTSGSPPTPPRASPIWNACPTATW